MHQELKTYTRESYVLYLNYIFGYLVLFRLTGIVYALFWSTISF